MTPIVRALLVFATSFFWSRVSLQLEIFALRQQLNVYRRSIRRPRVRRGDRIFWAWLARYCARWQEALVFVQSATVLAWRRRWGRWFGERSRQQEEAAAMTIWTYKAVFLAPIPPGRSGLERWLAEMNAYRAEGWEAFNVIPQENGWWTIFRRPSTEATLGT